MIDIQEFVTKIQAVLNGTDSLVSSLPRPDTSTYFDVRSPELPFADSVASLENKQTRFPVMVEQNSAGRYEAFPDVNMWSMSLTMTFLFPVANTLAVRNYFEYLASAVNGKQINFGSSSGYCVCALGVPTMGQMQYLDMNQYSQVKESINAIFGKTVNLSREWSTMTCEFYLSGSKNAGQTNGLIYGNQVTHTLSFALTGSGAIVSETIIPVQRSMASSAMTYEQQGVTSPLQKGIAQSGALAWTLTAMVRANGFWSQVISLSAQGTMKDRSVTLTETYSVGGANWSVETMTCVIKDIGFTHDLGKPVSAIITLEPQLTVGTL